MKYIKPPKLKEGDTIAALSPSWGGPSAFPHIYENGIRVLRDIFGLNVKEYPTARMSPEKLYDNPKIRARDVTDAFADREVKAIITTIGGDDSIRILPYLNLNIIIRNPKIIMGYSDTSTILTYLNQHGLVT